jgi:pimeloyl-ACP methyl ester carboxylesterase
LSLEVLTARPSGAARPAPLIFVHGAFVAAWCWAEHFLPWFAARGWDAHAVSLRGHGASAGRGSLDSASLDDYVEDVVRVAGQLGERPVLIGHSMGAIVAQRAARRVGARALALLAPIPPHGLGGSLLTLALRDPPLFLALNAMQLGGGNPALRRVRDCLFSASVTESVARRHLARTQRESQRALADLAWPQQLWIREAVGVPALVVGARNDGFFTAAMIEETARFHGVEAKIFDDMAHAMMLEPDWERVAGHVHAWLEERMMQT